VINLAEIIRFIFILNIHFHIKRTLRKEKRSIKSWFKKKFW